VNQSISPGVDRHKPRGATFAPGTAHSGKKVDAIGCSIDGTGTAK